MSSEFRRSHRTRRTLAALGILLAASLGDPTPSAAEDRFWGLWARELRYRVWWERPFAALFSFPAMVVTTPFWAGTQAVGAMKHMGDDDGEGDAEDADEDGDE